MVAVIIGVWYLEPILNEGCLEPQAIEAHIKNCHMLKVKESCEWLDSKGIPKDHEIDFGARDQACYTASELSDFLLETTTQGKVKAK